MAQIFHPSTNTISKVTIFGGAFIVGAILYIYGVIIRSPYVTQVNVVREQPVQFSHEHHVRGLGIDCRYCHTSVETSAFAGLPPTETCMSCHSQIWSDSPMLEPVRASYREKKPIHWVRVHDLPDFAYFNHSIHVKKGVGCSTCHGQIDHMPLTWRAEPLTMEWCLECHRAPEKFVRPADEVFNMRWPPQNFKHGATGKTPPEFDQAAEGKKLVRDSHIPYEGRASRLTNCSTCHR